MSITYTTARRKRICDYALKYGKMKAYELYGVSRPEAEHIGRSQANSRFMAQKQRIRFGLSGAVWGRTQNGTNFKLTSEKDAKKKVRPQMASKWLCPGCYF